MLEGGSRSPAIDVQGLSVSFGGFKALDGVDLQVQVGEIHGVVGANGAGKSTLLEVLSGLVRPSSGSASVLGLNPIRQAGKLRAMVGVVSQETSLEEKLSALENLRYFGRLLDVPARELQARAERLIRFMGLWDRRDDRLETYSVGMKRKVHLTCSLIHEPRVLLVDEATAGLDPLIRKDLTRLVVEMARGRQMTVLLSTHDLDDARDICDRISMLHRGRMISSGSWEEISSAYEARLLLRGVSARDGPRLAELFPGRVSEGIDGYQVEASSVSEAYRAVQELERRQIRVASVSYGVPPGSIFEGLTGKAEEDSTAP
jgi:ABC-type multidrug transport system ATPase subunit